MRSTIYKLTCKTSDDCYIGVTNDLRKRLAVHKHEVKTSNRKVHKFIREHDGWENFDVQEVMTFEYTNPDEKHRLERFYYDFYQPTLNCYVPNRSSLDYYYEVKKPMLHN